MGQDVANVHSTKAVIDLSNEAVFIPLNIENSPFLYDIGAGKSVPHTCEVLPKCSLRDAKPSVQCGFEFGIPQRCSLRLLPADLGAWSIGISHYAKVVVRRLRSLKSNDLGCCWKAFP